MIRTRAFIIAASISALAAGTAMAGAPGTTRFNFLKINPSARAAAMGNSFGGMCDDVYSAYWNPAGLVRMQPREVSFSRIQWLEGINYSWLAYGVNGSGSEGGDSDNEFNALEIDNFDNGAGPNLVNGAMGTWNDSDQSGSSYIDGRYYKDESANVYGGSGYSYETSYDVRNLPDGNRGYAGVWTALNNVNAGKYMHLAFMVKGAAGGESFKVGLKDMSGGEKKLDVSKYARVAGNWTKIVVPMSDFSGIDLANLENLSFTFSGAGKVYIDNIKFTGAKLPKRAFAVSVAKLDSGMMDEYIETDAAPYYEKTGAFSASETMLALSYAREFTITGMLIPIGFNLKLINEKLHPSMNPSWGAAIDAGAMHDFSVGWGNVVMGVVFQNMGTATPADSSNDPLPFNVRTSIAAYPRKYAVAFNADLDAPSDNKFKLSMGFEGWVASVLACRVGYSFGQDLGGVGAGLGFKVGGVNVDYALAPYSEFGNTHRLSLTYKFGVR